MDTTKSGITRKITIATLMGLALSTTLFAGITHAQAPGGPGQGGQAQGQNGGGGGGGRGNRGGFGGVAGQTTFATGTIITGDAAAGTITIAGPNGNNQTVHVTADTKIYTQTTIKPSELKVGDKVQVAGVPTGITATTLQAGEMPDFLGGGGRGRGARGGGIAAPGANGAQTPNPADPTAQANTPPTPPPANATATGTVVGLNPLVISLSDEVTVTLKTSENTKLTRIGLIPYSQLKPGDKLTASGQSNPDGSFNATGLGINITTPGRGAGAFGPGAGGPGGGGQNGGGRGNRGGRGGGGGNGGN